MDPRTLACDLTRVCRPCPATNHRRGAAQRAGPQTESKQWPRGDFRDSFASSLRIAIFQPFLSSRLSRGTEKKARLLSPECLHSADGLDPPAHAHSRPSLASGWGRAPPRAGEPKGSLAPSWRDGDEGEARVSGGGDSLRILSLHLRPPNHHPSLGSC